MSDSSSRLPVRPSLEQLRNQAKDLLKAYRAGDRPAAARIHAVLRRSERDAPTLTDAQFVVAREHGFESWAKLVHHIEAIHPPGLGRLERLAEELATAYTSGNYEAIREINWLYGTAFGWDRNLGAMHERLPTWFASEIRAMDLALADARHLVARKSGFETWADLVQSMARPTAARPARTAPTSAASFYRITREDTIEVDGPLTDEHWNTVLGVMKEMRVTGLAAGGMTDAILERVSHLEQLVRLLIGGSGELTDQGVRHLARLSRLQELDLGGPKSIITDRGLQVLRHLPELRRFEMSWAQRISDVGLANLAACDRLASVNVLGTPTGDSTVNALVGKPHLRRFASGRLVTDAGLALFRRFPRFKTWSGGEVKYALMSFEAEPTHLLVDGPFTDKGLASLAELEGLAGLSLFRHTTGFTAQGLKTLAALPNLRFLGCDGKRCDDEAMRHIAALPKLGMLVAQSAIAGDAGFEALGRSRTIEYIWGRECPNLAGRGFAAMAAMPALRGLAVSCKNVGDAALATLSLFPALKELMPMDVGDAGFRHVGRCGQLEALWCMYCRDTTDIATEHIAGLSKLRSYYAGRTRITDKSLEILGAMPSLERLEFWEIAGITDAGIARLTALPRLREISISGSPRVTRAAAAMFPAGVQVNYGG